MGSVYGGLFELSSLPTTFDDPSPSLSDPGTNTDHFFNMLPRHMRLEQFAEWNEIKITSARVWDQKSVVPRTVFSANFQFVWYGLFNGAECELKRNFGNLYRDPDERKLQQQSFLVSKLYSGNLGGIFINRSGESLLESKLGFRCR